MKKKIQNICIPWIYFFAILTITEITLKIMKIPKYILPLPSQVLIELEEKFTLILANLLITMSEALIGFLIGNVLAITFAVLFSENRLIRQGLYPLVIGFQAIPVVALAPFISIWFGSGIIGKAIIAAILCYFPATVIATNGFINVNKNALDFINSLGATKWQVFKFLRLPSAIPGILAAFQVSTTLCTIGAIVGELAGSSKGVGFLIVKASYEYRTTTLFAVLIITSFTTLGFFKIVQYIGNYLGKKYKLSYAIPNE